MGVRFIEAAFLLDCLKNGARLGRSLNVGRQNLICSRDELIDAFRTVGRSIEQQELDRIYTAFVDLPNNTYSGNLFCEPLFELLGATEVVSVDYSDYEKATLIHDFNEPLPTQLLSAFDTVLDFGTLEHIFNVPVAFGNMLRAVKPGGHYIAALPCNNLPGHGLYQFSPEFFYSVLVPQNGFTLDRLLISEDITKFRFRVVPNPHTTKGRVTFINSKETSLFVRARRIGEVPAQLQAYQSDYVALWTNAAQKARSSADTSAKRLRSAVAALYRRIVPEPIRRLRQRLVPRFKRSPSIRSFEPYR